MTRVALFHTVAALTGRFEELADEYLADAEWYHVVDESVLDDMLDAGELTPNVTERICTQLALAQRGGADIVLDTCSSTSPAVDVSRKLVDVPIVKIDDPMTERAVEIGDRIVVVATAASTLGPSKDLVERKGEEAGRDVTVETVLVDEAFEARRAGDLEMHDELVSEAVEDFADDFDVVVLAQASMSHLESSLFERTSVPVLSSPDLAMEHIAELVSASP
ncbi:aspartate/glutamate racemase family protein [Natronosalvus rutilus]|uniref:Aspartate/glutamate racemase family protein n=1 Tax=Natronosalvus rutilus TaxID=2953753 RepID=A0A9E7NEX6_9EURY|nr:aspartate/glutamate racemase family protein [Natronosalvus rutilus]UTF55744.1 aspartate/glutamate racemase family protein [Natronosalvus rutilus]